MKTLKQYLDQNNISVTAAAKELGTTRGHLSNVVNGLSAGKTLAWTVELWSNGEVKHTSLLYPNPPKKEK